MAFKGAVPAELLERVAEIFRVLSDPSRLEILQALMNGPLAVGQVVHATGKGQANVSRHLALLAAAGLVSRTARGNQAIYEVADPLVYKLCDMVCGSIRNKLADEVKAHQRALRRA